MAEATTLARPYAKAVFGLAQQAGDFAGWSDALGKITAVVSNPAIAGLLNSPQLTATELASSVNDDVNQLQVVNQVAGVIGSSLHSHHSRRHFTSDVFNDGLINLRFHIAAQNATQQFLRLRLVQVIPVLRQAFGFYLGYRH